MKRFLRRFSSIYSPLDSFPKRHIGPEDNEIVSMLNVLKLSCLDDLVNKTVPHGIHVKKPTRLGQGISESEVILRLKEIATMNQNYKSYLGMGYYGTNTPLVVLRNVMENPAWYTQYTPYKPEIAQGRLESLLNYQQMVQDLTGFYIY